MLIIQKMLTLWLAHFVILAPNLILSGSVPPGYTSTSAEVSQQNAEDHTNEGFFEGLKKIVKRMETYLVDHFGDSTPDRWGQKDREEGSQSSSLPSGEKFEGSSDEVMRSDDDEAAMGLKREALSRTGAETIIPGDQPSAHKGKSSSDRTLNIEELEGPPSNPSGEAELAPKLFVGSEIPMSAQDADIRSDPSSDRTLKIEGTGGSSALLSKDSNILENSLSERSLKIEEIGGAMPLSSENPDIGRDPSSNRKLKIEAIGSDLPRSSENPNIQRDLSTNRTLKIEETEATLPLLSEDPNVHNDLSSNRTLKIEESGDALPFSSENPDIWSGSSSNRTLKIEEIERALPLPSEKPNIQNDLSSNRTLKIEESEDSSPLSSDNPDIRTGRSPNRTLKIEEIERALPLASANPIGQRGLSSNRTLRIEESGVALPLPSENPNLHIDSSSNRTLKIEETGSALPHSSENPNIRSDSPPNGTMKIEDIRGSENPNILRDSSPNRTLEIEEIRGSSSRPNGGPQSSPSSSPLISGGGRTLKIEGVGDASQHSFGKFEALNGSAISRTLKIEKFDEPLSQTSADTALSTASPSRSIEPSMGGIDPKVLGDSSSNRTLRIEEVGGTLSRDPGATGVDPASSTTSVETARHSKNLNLLSDSPSNRSLQIEEIGRASTQLYGGKNSAAAASLVGGNSLPNATGIPSNRTLKIEEIDDLRSTPTSSSISDEVTMSASHSNNLSEFSSNRTLKIEELGGLLTNSLEETELHTASPTIRGKAANHAMSEDVQSGSSSNRTLRIEQIGGSSSTPYRESVSTQGPLLIGRETPTNLNASTSDQTLKFEKLDDLLSHSAEHIESTPASSSISGEPAMGASDSNVLRDSSSNRTLKFEEIGKPQASDILNDTLSSPSLKTKDIAEPSSQPSGKAKSTAASPSISDRTPMSDSKPLSNAPKSTTRSLVSTSAVESRNALLSNARTSGTLAKEEGRQEGGSTSENLSGHVVGDPAEEVSRLKALGSSAGNSSKTGGDNNRKSDGTLSAGSSKNPTDNNQGSTRAQDGKTSAPLEGAIRSSRVLDSTTEVNPKKAELKDPLSQSTEFPRSSVKVENTSGNPSGRDVRDAIRGTTESIAVNSSKGASLEQEADLEGWTSDSPLMGTSTNLTGLNKESTQDHTDGEPLLRETALESSTPSSSVQDRTRDLSSTSAKSSDPPVGFSASSAFPNSSVEAAVTTESLSGRNVSAANSVAPDSRVLNVTEGNALKRGAEFEGGSSESPLRVSPKTPANIDRGSTGAQSEGAPLLLESAVSSSTPSLRVQNQTADVNLTIAELRDPAAGSSGSTLSRSSPVTMAAIRGNESTVTIPDMTPTGLTNETDEATTPNIDFTEGSTAQNSSVPTTLAWNASDFTETPEISTATAEISTIEGNTTADFITAESTAPSDELMDQTTITANVSNVSAGLSDVSVSLKPPSNSSGAAGRSPSKPSTLGEPGAASRRIAGALKASTPTRPVSSAALDKNVSALPSAAQRVSPSVGSGSPKLASSNPASGAPSARPSTSSRPATRNSKEADKASQSKTPLKVSTPQKDSTKKPKTSSSLRPGTSKRPSKSRPSATVRKIPRMREEEITEIITESTVTEEATEDAEALMTTFETPTEIPSTTTEGPTTVTTETTTVTTEASTAESTTESSTTETGTETESDTEATEFEDIVVTRRRFIYITRSTKPYNKTTRVTTDKPRSQSPRHTSEKPKTTSGRSTSQMSSKGKSSSPAPSSRAPSTSRKPSTASSQPHSTSGKPHSTSKKPHSTSEKPNSTSGKPAATSPKPSSRAKKSPSKSANSATTSGERSKPASTSSKRKVTPSLMRMPISPPKISLGPAPTTPKVSQTTRRSNLAVTKSLLQPATKEPDFMQIALEVAPVEDSSEEDTVEQPLAIEIVPITEESQ